MAGLGTDQSHTLGYSEKLEPAMLGCVALELKEEAEHTCRGLWGWATSPGPLTAYL